MVEFVKEIEKMQKDEMLSTKEAARRLNVSQMTIYRRINDGSLKAVWIRRWRIPSAELEHFIREQTRLKAEEQSQKLYT